MKKLLYNIFMILALTGVVVTGTLSQETPSIYVKSLEAKGVDKPLAGKVSSEIEDAVIESGKYKTMSQDQVKQLMDNAGKQMALGCDSEACIKQIMQTTQSDYLLYGTIEKEGAEYIISVKLMYRDDKGNAFVKKKARQFTTSKDTRTLMKMAKNIVAELHGEKVDVEEESKAEDQSLAAGSLLVKSVPAGAVVKVDGNDKGTTPVTVGNLDAGEYMVSIEKDGYETETKTAIVQSNKAVTVNVLLKKVMLKKTYTFRSEFSWSKNPNGVWSYGWRSGNSGVKFLTDEEQIQVEGFKGWVSKKETNAGPSVLLNSNAYQKYGVSPGSIAMHPGQTGQMSVVRWTSPFSGTISLNGSFGSGDIGIVDVRIEKNNAVLFQKLYTANDEIFSLQTTVSAGDAVDFIVGAAGNFTSDNTPLEVTISKF